MPRRPPGDTPTAVHRRSAADGEDAITRWLARVASPGIGDDTASLEPAPYLATVDSQIAGVHVTADCDPAVVARRLLAVNLSDIATTGGSPRYALLSLVAPPGFDHRRFLRALVAAAARCGVELIGGDLARADQLVATLTLLATPPPSGRPHGRGRARAGDQLWVGGTLGESALGAALVARGARLRAGRVDLPASLALPPALCAHARRAVRRHLEPSPQLALGRWLGEQPRAAVLDVSDGLARDLHRLCRRSRVGALIDEGSLPLAAGAWQLAAALHLDASRLALAGGEDYVLLVALPAPITPPATHGATRIGTITRGTIRLRRTNGTFEELAAAGWDHLQAGGS